MRRCDVIARRFCVMRVLIVVGTWLLMLLMLVMLFLRHVMMIRCRILIGAERLIVYFRFNAIVKVTTTAATAIVTASRRAAGCDVT